MALAQEHARMVEAVRRGERELHEKGDGRPLAQLRAEIESIPVDDIPGAIEAVQAEHDAANRDAQALAARVATTQREMDEQAQADTATQAATDQQAAVAALRRITEEATLMHLAALLLDASLTQVEMAGTSGMLARIAELFRTITGGTYTRLEVDDPGDGSAGLIAVHRDFPDERKAVADLSEGERDQLFLALRLAAIEDHVATAPPLPFVCDDILQTFDDDRATGGDAGAGATQRKRAGDIAESPPASGRAVGAAGTGTDSSVRDAGWRRRENLSRARERSPQSGG